MTDVTKIHTPVLRERCVEILRPALERGGLFVDCTLGMGGHTEAILQEFSQVHVIGIDRDQDALSIARERLHAFASRMTFVHTAYDRVAQVIAEHHPAGAQGILFDLGVSSLRLDRAERGFAYAQDAPLDMRMNADDTLTAADIVAEYSEGELANIFRAYGDEKLAGRYARAIIAARAEHPILRSAQLVSILTDATPGALLGAGHPAKRVFQALRIEVNQELAIVEQAIPAAVDALAVGGRIVVMSYQSLEDKIVKRAFTALSTSKSPLDLPVERDEDRPVLRVITRGAEQASDEERARNPRSIPVRLRAAEKVREAA
jgi:16S rRNA (cytosine1402-N4)-methyltransferase